MSFSLVCKLDVITRIKQQKLLLFCSTKFSYERSYGLALITECDKIRLFRIILSLMNVLCKVAALVRKFNGRVRYTTNFNASNHMPNKFEISI